MSKFTFEGDVDSLSSRQLEFIEEILEKRGFVQCTITVEAVGKAGDNYMANVKRITAKDSGGIKTFKMIAKIAPKNEIARKRVNVHKIFSNEATMYIEILPKLVEIQIAAGIPKEEQFRFAECYSVLLEQPDELILLEDLQLSNFVILDRFKSLTDSIVRKILKNFAVLHSLSLAFKKQEPETFTTFKTKLIDIFAAMDDEKEYVMYGTRLENDVIETLNDEKYKKAVRGTVSQQFYLQKMYNDQADLSQSVVIQGDGWTNNIMFRMEDNEPVECIMIDYQLSKVSNPACDLLYMIFNCTDHATRHNHYHEWIKYYHFELDKSLGNFGMKVDLVYPKDQLDADLKKYSKLFFSVSIMVSSISIRKPENAEKVKQAMDSGATPENLIESFQMSNMDAESITLFRNRIEGLVDSCREFGYLNDKI